MPFDGSTPPAATEAVITARAHIETHASAVSWPAVLGGCLVIASLSLMLLALGAGFDLSTLSPWSRTSEVREPATATIAWLVVVQVITGAFGGYVAGRLRGRWTRVHGDEVFFRDTVHGFLVWALAVVLSAAFLASAATRMVGVQEAGAGDRNDAPTSSSYYADMFLRTDRPIPPGLDDATVRAVVHGIVAHSLSTGEMPTADAAYLTELISQRTGLTAAQATTRMAEVIQQARDAAETNRRVTARVLLWTFLALLCGAFTTSLAATVGGRQRDRVAMI